MTIRKPARIQFDAAALEDASATARVINRVQDAILGTLDQLVRDANSAAPAAPAAVPTGVVLPFAGSAEPSGYLMCNGQAVSRATYAALFAVIGTAFGVGDGATTFNVPSMARRVPVGAGGTGTATLGNAVGNSGGEEAHTLTAAESGVPAHTHPFDGAAQHFIQAVQFATSGVSGFFGLSTGSVPNAGDTGSNTTASAASAHNTVQPSLVVNYIIKA